MRGEIQASDSELRLGLKERRILVLDGPCTDFRFWGRLTDHAGYLRPIAPVHLNTILELLLNYLISLSLSHEAAPVDDLVSALADEHDMPREVSNQVMSWFGQVEDGMWKMDANALVAEIGLGIIRHYKVCPSFICIAPASSPLTSRRGKKKARAYTGDRVSDKMEERRRRRVRVGRLATATLGTFSSTCLPWARLILMQ